MLENLDADSIIKEIWPILNSTIRSEKPVLYFGRAIRGGRENLENSRKIVSEANKHFFVISKHVILDKEHDKDDVSDFERKWRERFTGINVRQRDIRMLRTADCFAADVTVDSVGVGYEIGVAQHRKIPSVLFQHEATQNKSTMRLYTTRLTTPTLREYTNLRNFKSPILCYDNQNVEEVAKKGFERLSGCFLTTYF